MSLFETSKKNKIIEKKIILKKKNKSLSQKSFLDKQTPSKYIFPSSSKINSSQFEKYNEVNHADYSKRLDYNINNNNYALNQVQTISEAENIGNNNCKNGNLINLKRYYYPKKYCLYQKRNESYDNNIDNIYNLQTPIKNHNYKNNIKTNTENKSSELYTHYENSFITRNSTAECTNNDRYNNINDISKLNPISYLSKNKREIYSCYLNKSKNTERLKKVNSITNFIDTPYIIGTSRLYNNNIYNKPNSDCKENTISYVPQKKIYDKRASLEFYKPSNYIDLFCPGFSNNTTYKAKKEINNINCDNICHYLNKKNSSIDKNIYIDRKNNNKLKNAKHIFVHKRRLSSFLINNQNKNNKNNCKKENNGNIKNKYVYKKVKKSFSCVNLKEKIDNERYNILKSKRKSIIVDINKINNEFDSIEKEKENHNGGKIDLFNNKISNFKLYTENNDNNNESDFKNINVKCLLSIIKIQRWFKFHIKIKKIIAIQRKFRKYCFIKYIINTYRNNIIIKKSMPNNCEIITKKYKYNNIKFIEKIIFIQNMFVEYLLKKKRKINKIMNNNCFISKIRKNKKIIDNIVMLQRKIREYFCTKEYIKNRKIFDKCNCFDINDMEISSSLHNKNSNHKKSQKNIPYRHQRNKEICNIESYTNSSIFYVANEYETNNKRMKMINKNESINSLFSNYQNNHRKNSSKCNKKNKINIHHNNENKSKNSSYKSSYKEYLSNENSHKLPQNCFSKIYKYSKYNTSNGKSYDRYNEESSIIEDYEISNKKYISLISPFYSLNDKENSNKSNNIIKNISNKKIYLKDLFCKGILKKLIKELRIINRRFSIIGLIMLILQRIVKNINQFVFFKISFNLNSKTKFKHNLFFSILKRLILFEKINIPNEIIYIINNYIPKNKKKNLLFIPYINTKFEEKLINTQLFSNNNKQLLYFIQTILKYEKNIIIPQEKISEYLKKNKLNYRNIFTIMRYIDSFYNSLISNNKYENKAKSEFSYEDDITNTNDENIIIKYEKKTKNNCDIINNINNLYENNFWKDDDFLISNNNIINKGNECISIVNNNNSN